MITYEVAGPTEAGDYLIGYATPGAPAPFTVAATASCQAGAIAACARLNAPRPDANLVNFKRAIDFLAVGPGAEGEH